MDSVKDNPTIPSSMRCGGIRAPGIPMGYLNMAGSTIVASGMKRSLLDPLGLRNSLRSPEKDMVRKSTAKRANSM